MTTKIAREAIRATRAILDPMFNEYGGRRRFADLRKRMIQEMIAKGPLTVDEVTEAKRRYPTQSGQEAQNWALRFRAGPWFPPGEPERG